MLMNKLPYFTYGYVLEKLSVCRRGQSALHAAQVRQSATVVQKAEHDPSGLA